MRFFLSHQTILKKIIMVSTKQSSNTKEMLLDHVIMWRCETDMWKFSFAIAKINLILKYINIDYAYDIYTNVKSTYTIHFYWAAYSYYFYLSANIKNVFICVSDWFTYLFVFGVYQWMIGPNRGWGEVKGERGKSKCAVCLSLILFSSLWVCLTG